MSHYAKQAIISVSSCLAKRRLFCGYQKFKPVGFCVICEFRGNYKQGNSKQISTSKIIRPLYESKLYVHYTNHILYVHYTNIRTPTSPINCNLHFYHSIYLMIKKFDWRKKVPIYQDSPYNTDLQRVKSWQMAVWQGGCSRVSAMFILDICHVYVKCMLWYRYLVFVTALQSVCNGASKPLYTCRHFVYCYIGA